MKKLLLAMLSVILVFGLAACSNSDDKDGQSQTEESKEVKFEYKRGEWTDNTFNSDFLNLTFDLPEGWVIATDEELTNLMQQGAEIAYKDQEIDFNAMLENGSTLYEVAIANVKTGESIIIILENLSKHLGGSSVTVDEYLDLVMEGIMNTDEAKEYEFEVLEREDTKLGDETYRVSHVSVYYGLVGQDYYVRKIDKYLVSIIANYHAENPEGYTAFLDSVR